MAENYYILRLWDPSLPGYVSGDKIYVGTEGDIRNAVIAMEKDEVCEDTRKAVTAYLAGNRSATHNIAYNEIPALEPVHFISESRCTLGGTEWEHINTWHCTYNLRCKSAIVSQIVVRQRQKYYRCVKVWFENLEYISIATGQWSKLNDFFLGNGFLLDVAFKPNEDFTLNNLLYVVEEIHPNREEAEQALTSSDRLLFKPFFDEIFGDG